MRRGFMVAEVAAGLLLVSLLAREWGSRAHLPVSRFEGAVRAYLADRGEGDALLVARYHQEGLQARTGHPVMTDMASPTWIPYRPSLGPAFAGMYRDLYGLDLAPGPGAGPMPVAWHAVWPEKTLAEWRRLGERYGFRYVVAPGFMELPLKPVVEGVHERLYRVGGEGAP